MTETRVIRPGDVVALDFALTTAAGQLIEQSDAGDPLLYLHGAENILPGLEERLLGKAAGEAFDVLVPCAEAFGERMDVEAQAVPRGAFPEDAELEVGAGVEVEGPDGELMLWVTRVEEEEVFLDPNHPLAGEDLRFQGRILEIRAATEDELAHGHPHGPEGHDHH